MCFMVSCGLADAGIDIGGDILYSKQPCPIEAINDDLGLVSEGRLYYHDTGVLLLKSNGSPWKMSRNTLFFTASATRESS